MRRNMLWALLLAVLALQGAAGRRLTDAATTLPTSALAGEEPAAATDPLGEVEMKIIDGQDVTTGDFDFMVALFMSGRFFCGGALLDNMTVLTAAHCMVDTGIVSDPSTLTVWSLGTEYPVDQVFAHPGYSASTIPQDNQDMTFEGALHDLAVIKLQSPGVAGNPPTVQLPKADTPLAPGQRLQIAGWGTTEDGQPSNVLKYAVVDYLPAYACPADYTDVLCGGGTGQNTCNGDSGGPLVIRDPTTRAATTVGITSHGPDCLAGPQLAYGYYTDVRKYLDAITTWQAGQAYQWSGDAPSNSSSSGSGSGTNSSPDSSSGAMDGSTSSGTTDSSSSGSSDSSGPGGSPIEWQPVPGWQWGGSSDGSSPSWQELFCQIFGC